MSIPKQQQALVLENDAFAVKTVPTPDPSKLPPGSAIVQVLTSVVSPTFRAILTSKGHGPPISTQPFVTGQACIGRIVAAGPDAAVLAPGDLVYVDTLLRVRDDPTNKGVFLWGYFGVDPAGVPLGDAVWRDSSNTSYAAAPLENCTKLDEDRLINQLGYTVDDLAGIARMLVSFGGLTEISLGPGETIAIAPATGAFGGAAVHVALALGAHVIAAARTKDALDRVFATHSHTGRLTTALMTGEDAEADAKALIAAAPRNGVIDAYLDFVPVTARNTTYLKSALLALRPKGRACVMGGSMTDVSIPYTPLFAKNLRIYGRFMYERDAPAKLLQLIEMGALKLGEKAGLKTSAFKLGDFERAFATAEGEIPGTQHAVVFKP